MFFYVEPEKVSEIETPDRWFRLALCAIYAAPSLGGAMKFLTEGETLTLASSDNSIRKFIEQTPLHAMHGGEISYKTGYAVEMVLYILHQLQDHVSHQFTFRDPVVKRARFAFEQELSHYRTNYTEMSAETRLREQFYLECTGEFLRVDFSNIDLSFIKAAGDVLFLTTNPFQEPLLHQKVNIPTCLKLPHTLHLCGILLSATEIVSGETRALWIKLEPSEARHEFKLTLFAPDMQPCTRVRRNNNITEVAINRLCDRTHFNLRITGALYDSRHKV